MSLCSPAPAHTSQSYHHLGKPSDSFPPQFYYQISKRVDDAHLPIYPRLFLNYFIAMQMTIPQNPNIFETIASTSGTTATTTIPSIDFYQIDALLVIRCMIYLVLVYRAIEILMSQNQKLTAKDRITQRYSFANSELIGTLNREDCELMSTTIRNTITNVKITEEGIRPREKQLPRKSVKFSEKHLYYDPAVFPEEDAVEEILNVKNEKEVLAPFSRIDRPAGVPIKPKPDDDEVPEQIDIEAGLKLEQSEKTVTAVNEETKQKQPETTVIESNKQPETNNKPEVQTAKQESQTVSQDAKLIEGSTQN